MKAIVLVLITVALTACGTAPCNQASASASGKAPQQKGAVAVQGPSSSADHVKVYKTDGSLQCGQGKLIPVKDMEKDLQGIKVFNSYNKNDGMMRIQVCGAPTGNCNVYEIDRKDLDKALSLGFKEWSAE
jgi:curli biogenesis system outer membrane secretion channel CsgG